jgi:hypothetical protein
MLEMYETLKTCRHMNYDEYRDECLDCGEVAPTTQLVSNCCGAGIAGRLEDISAANNSLTTCPECREHCEAIAANGK